MKKYWVLFLTVSSASSRQCFNSTQNLEDGNELPSDYMPMQHRMVKRQLREGERRLTEVFTTDDTARCGLECIEKFFHFCPSSTYGNSGVCCADIASCGGDIPYSDDTRRLQGDTPGLDIPDAKDSPPTAPPATQIEPKPQPQPQPKPSPPQSKSRNKTFCSFDAPSNSRGLKYWSCPYDAPLCGGDGLFIISDDNKNGIIQPTKTMDRAKICRYKIQIDPKKGDKWDYFNLKIESLKDVSVIVTSAKRINDCDFQEFVMQEGISSVQEFTYPNSAYIVARAVNWEAEFRMSYEYFNKEQQDYETEEELEAKAKKEFMKTTTFRWIIIGSIILILVVSLLLCAICFFRARMQMVLYRVEMLEGSTGQNQKNINAEGLEVEALQAENGPLPQASPFFGDMDTIDPVNQPKIQLHPSMQTYLYNENKQKQVVADSSAIFPEPSAPTSPQKNYAQPTVRSDYDPNNQPQDAAAAYKNKMLGSLDRALRKDQVKAEQNYNTTKNILGDNAGFSALPPLTGPGTEKKSGW